MMRIALVVIFSVGLAGMVMAGAPGPGDTGGIPLRGPDDPPQPVSKPEARPVGSFEFVHNCTDERLPDYDPHGPACEDRETPTAVAPAAETEIVLEPLPPPTPLTMPCTRAHCDD